MSQADKKDFADGAAAKGIAGLIVLASVAGILAVAWDDLFPPPVAELEASGNPELAACLQERVGAVNKMREDGIIDSTQYDQFRARAESFCEGQFGDG